MFKEGVWLGTVPNQTLFLKVGGEQTSKQVRKAGVIDSKSFKLLKNYSLSLILTAIFGYN
ncbi:hypothetical protein [Acidaminobacter hydrogenoformans]|uniref:hypothetical protein n=1 Tax=Acidaminobacter hydrogenoformans TaxID=65403 RepID=UPI000B8760A2|nr:hypothetical protein [Acidaminobacter hydrogenoformans]